MTERDSLSAERAGTQAPRSRVRTAAGTGNGRTSFSDEEVRRMIAEAAYLRAERRGFAPGAETDDWMAAEREILERLGARRPEVPSLDARAALQLEGALLEVPRADATGR